MATPAQIRRERKTALRSVKSELRTLDTISETIERYINRVLRVSKRFPDTDDATFILTELRKMDTQLDKVISAGDNFAKFVVAL